MLGHPVAQVTEFLDARSQGDGVAQRLGRGAALEDGHHVEHGQGDAEGSAHGDLRKERAAGRGSGGAGWTDMRMREAR